MKGAGAGLSMIPTPYTQIAGAVLSTVGSLWGNTGSVNEHTGEINKASGISKWLGLGPSARELKAKSNRIKNSIVDKDITEHLRAEYYMDPNNSANNNIFYAAEGGVAPNLTPAYLDSREVVVSPDRGSAVRLPYAEGTDTIPAMVMPYSGVLSEDIEYKKGISFADLGDKIDKSFPDNTRAKQLLMQKALNAQEMKKVSKKTKNGVPAYANGETEVHRKKEKVNYVIWNNKFGYFDAEGGFHDMSSVSNPNLPDSAYLGRYERVPVAVKDSVNTSSATKQNTSTNNVTYPTGAKYPMDPVVVPQINWEDFSTPTYISDPNGAVIPQKDVTKTTREVGLTNFFTPYLNGAGVWGYPTVKQYKTDGIDGVTQAAPIVDTAVNTPAEVKIAQQQPSVTTKTSSKKSGAVTPEATNKTTRTALLPKLYDVGERHWLRGNVTEPKQSFASLASVTPTKLKTQKLTPVTPASNTTNSTATPNASGLDFDMLDYLNLAGPLANMFAPDAEAVRAHTISPVYGPTSYDVTPEMRQIASNRATANYDANQVNHNTGANMTFKAMTQLNSDKAAAAALSNKANVQNQLAFQNANIANSAMQFNANASHTAEVESAQNRAAARNIRRKGFGDFFTNIGKIRRDKRLSARDAGLYQAMLPYLEYGMTSDQLKKITELYA